MDQGEVVAWLGLGVSILAVGISVWSARQTISLQRTQFQESRRALLRVKDLLSTSTTADAPMPDRVSITIQNIGQRAALDVEAEILETTGIVIDPWKMRDVNPGEQIGFVADLRKWKPGKDQRMTIAVLMTYRDTERHAFEFVIFAPPRMDVDPPFEFHNPFVLQALLDGKPSPISHHPEVIAKGDTLHVG